MLCRVVSTIAQPAGVFVQILVSSASLVAVAEIGDKTPLATIALASEYQAIFWVTLGTTIGVLIANIPAVFFGAAYIANIPMNRVRILASIAFIGFGVFQVTQTF